jgi:hypothetical protein
MSQETIKVGSIVKGNPKTSTIKGYYRIRSIRGGKANLCGPFGRQIEHKGILLKDLIECENEWYAKWQQSETYQCM